MEYIRKQSTVEAEQFLGQDIEGIRVIKNKITYSLNKKLFYPSNVNATNWLSIEKVKIEGEEKHESYPFAFHEIKSLPAEDVNEENKHLVDLYCRVFGLEGQVIRAYCDRGTVRLGDWVVRDNNKTEIYTDEQFKELFTSYEVRKESRCCGRCDGHNDICVGDRFCDAHNVQGCEECFGKR